MKKLFVKDIREKDQVSGSFLVTKKEAGVSKSGKPYLVLRLMDSTGELEARVWESADELGKRFEKNDVVDVKGFAVAYQNSVQVNVSSISARAEGEYSLSDFLPSSGKDPAEMLSRVDAVIAGVEDANIKGLLAAVFNDPAVRERFATAPAAKAMHHPYLGGLIEHALSICGLVEKVSSHYGAGINRDLLYAGALLHDIGKIYELSYKRSFEYTDEGRLLGHITMGIELIDEKLRDLKDFPRELAVRLKHMLLSHHGHLEFGSPKRPKTIEAIILYYLDDMDAKVNTVQALVLDGRDGAAWTPYQRIFERYIYKGQSAPPQAEAEKPGEENSGGEKSGEEPEDENGTLNLFR
ncbi:MAG: HD domain-containing protein [Deltaproteobacteria bacterium]|nr:HD domain-containing protein [Deltaproteobacteria bacterium]